jgi:hypothetical protein
MMDLQKYFKRRWITRNRVRAPIDYIIGRNDKWRLEKKLSQLRTFNKQSHAIVEDLQPYYDEYISKFSSDIMAISLELAVFLMALCHLTEPKRVLDYLVWQHEFINYTNSDGESVDWYTGIVILDNYDLFVQRVNTGKGWLITERHILDRYWIDPEVRDYIRNNMTYYPEGSDETIEVYSWGEKHR